MQGDGEWGDLRRIAPLLSERDYALFVEALAIANWHASHPFSPLTGEATKAAKGGWVLVDPSTGREHFPRTDNAVIVAVTDADDRLLLGSNVMWEPNRYSLLAGFVEPGESLEAAVVREVFEESGIWVANPVYLGSQPWPFPASLMLGFSATVDSSRESTLTPDGEEIGSLRWFSRDELAASLDEIRLPGSTSIARAIIEEWFGGPLEGENW
jgi:NAD+ diphosphatase